MVMLTPDDVPAYAVPENRLVPVDSFPSNLEPIPPSRMFLINKALKVYQAKYPGEANL